MLLRKYVLYRQVFPWINSKGFWLPQAWLLFHSGISWVRNAVIKSIRQHLHQERYEWQRDKTISDRSGHKQDVTVGNLAKSKQYHWLSKCYRLKQKVRSVRQNLLIYNNQSLNLGTIRWHHQWQVCLWRSIRTSKSKQYLSDFLWRKGSQRQLKERTLSQNYSLWWYENRDYEAAYSATLW